MKGKPIAVCHMCRRRTDEEHYCSGCRVYLCPRCDINLCTGVHVPIDHVRQMPGEYHGEDRDG